MYPCMVVTISMPLLKLLENNCMKIYSEKQLSYAPFYS